VSLPAETPPGHLRDHSAAVAAAQDVEHAAALDVRAARRAADDRICSPPLDTIVPLAAPPDDTISWPPFSTVTPESVPR